MLVLPSPPPTLHHHRHYHRQSKCYDVIRQTTTRTAATPIRDALLLLLSLLLLPLMLRLLLLLLVLVWLPVFGAGALKATRSVLRMGSGITHFAPRTLPSFARFCRTTSQVQGRIQELTRPSFTATTESRMPSSPIDCFSSCLNVDVCRVLRAHMYGMASIM